VTIAAPTRHKRRAYAPRVSADQRRTQLLDVALRLVVTGGHGAVTMEAVAEHAGVTKPVVYGLYANRADLLGALLRREQEQAMAQVLEVLPANLDHPPSDIGEALARFLDRFLPAVRAAPERWYCILMQVPGMPPEFHAAREQARAVVLARAQRVTAELLRALGAPPELDPEIVGHTMVTLAEMAARLVLTDPDRYHPDRFTSTLRAATAWPGPRASSEPERPAAR
jgi:AcrR family transcriptional regulator